jgi:hypothetical protein
MNNAGYFAYFYKKLGMRYFFAILFFLHGLISLMGFLKAFNLFELKQFEATISKAAGICWLIASILLFIVAIQALSKSELFWVAGGVALIASQLLLFWFWKDAKYGTIINVILLLLVVINFSMWNHHRNALQKGGELVASCKPLRINENDDLPTKIQHWLENVGALESEAPASVEFTQKGKMRLAPDKSWIGFNANQYVRLNDPAFLWATRVGDGEIMQFSGVDRFEKGTGSMHIALFGLFNVVDAKGPEMDQGTAVRYLAEIVWYPWLAKSKWIKWEKADDQRVKAVFSLNSLRVEGVFTFNKEGFPVQFKAMRYNEEMKKMIPWRVDIDEGSFKKKGDVLIPTKASVSWEYKIGDFHWLDLEVLDYSQ